MARSFSEVGPDRVQIQEGGGLLSIFGLPFFCAGIFVCLAALGIVPMSTASRTPSFASPLLALMGLIFTTVGGILVFGRAWTTVDATRREVAKEWGLLWPMYRMVRPVDDFTMVSISFEPGGSDSAARYPLTLRSSSGSTLELCRFTDYAGSHACAVAVARRLGIELEDATTDHARRMPADQGDLSLRERVRADGVRAEPCERPASARSTVIDESGRTRIVIPNPRLHPVVAAFMLLPLALPAVMVGPLSRFFRQTNTPDPIGWFFLAFLGVGFVILPAASALGVWLRSRFGRTIVTVSSDGITIEKRGIWRTSVRESIAAGDIVDLDFSTRESVLESTTVATVQRIRESQRSAAAPVTISPRTERMIAALGRLARGRGVTVKTRQGLVTFGEGLEDGEIRYLHAGVRRALVR